MSHRTLEAYWQEAGSFYKSSEWKRLSRKCKERDNWTCRACFFHAETADEKRRLHAHHRTPRRPLPYVTALDVLDNLTTRCDECHKKDHPHMGTASRGSKSAPPKMFRASSTRRRRW